MELFINVMSAFRYLYVITVKKIRFQYMTITNTMMAKTIA